MTVRALTLAAFYTAEGQSKNVHLLFNGLKQFSACNTIPAYVLTAFSEHMLLIFSMLIK
jgi:hypothetical protein